MGEDEGGTIWENTIETCVITICEIEDQSKLNAWNRGLKTGALGQPEGWYGEGDGRGVHDGEHVHPWLIYVNVWQKPPQYCKVISLQLK